MKRIALSAALIVCLAGLALSATGCELLAQKATEGALETATGGAVKVDGDKVTIKGEDGTEASVAGDTEIPADFPSDVPLRDDGTVKAVITSQAPGGGTGYMLNIRFKVPQTELLDWYKSEFEKGGWTVTASVATADGGMVAAEKGDLQVNVVASTDDGDGFTSAITMQVGPKSQ